MKKTSTNPGTSIKKCLVLILAIFSLAFSQSTYAHSVDSYSGTCASGPQYKVTAVVSNVNNTSNYRWQWKNASAVWVCFVNGANTINGNSYNVSGSVYNLTTTPGPIIFTNPNIGLQGLEIRMVISDGNGVNPCTLPNGNTWTSTTNHFINVTNTSCGICNGQITGLYFNKLDNGADLPITNGATFTVAQLGALYNMEVATTGTVGSVKFTITGPTPSTTIENSAPYNSPASGSGAWTGAPGNYSVNVKIYTGSGATGSICHEITVTFILTSTGSIGDRVWYDTDRDGIQDASENGISGVTVKLRNASNTVIATTTTNASGNYLFSGLAAGTYSVEFPVTVYGYILSPAYVGSDRNVDSDPSVSTGVTPAITLSAGQNIVNVDAGFAPDCSCVNSAGNLLVNGSFENGTTGWTWSAANGSLTTGTGYVACGAANGFNNQSSGTSKVWQDVNVAAGSTISFKGFAGTHTAGIACSPTLSLIFLNAANTVLGQSNVTVTRDVDINNSQLEQYSITGVAPAGATKVRVQSSITCNTMKMDAFCLTVAPGCAGAGTWNLSLPNGTLGTSQAYIANGVTIMAYGFNNGTPGTPTALYGKNAGFDETGLGINSDPDHEIDNNHFVQLDLNQVIAAGITSGTMTIGSMQAGEPANVYGSNTLGTRGTLLMTVPVTLDNIPFAMPGFPTYRYISVQTSTATPANVLLEQVSFSCPPIVGSIGDRVWEDLNRNGLQDVNEPGIAGATVTLNSAAGTVTATTDVNGAYNFANLPAATYSVTFTTPAGFAFTALPNVGTDDAIDSDPVGGVVSNIVLAAGEVNNTIDAGFYKVISLSGNVWHDVNGMNDNLVNNTGPLQVPPAIVIPTGLRISLVDAVTNHVISVALVQGNGVFNFPNVSPGFYTLLLSQLPGVPGQLAPFATVPSGWVNTGEHLGLTPGRDAVINGKLSVSITTVSVTNANFGIQLNNDDTGIN